jgi:hypothetical protein
MGESKISNTSKEEVLRTKLRAVLLSVFLELERPLNRKLDNKDFEFIKDKITRFDQTVESDDLIKIYFILNKALDELNLIKVDNKRAYDSTSIETENEQKGL